MQCKHWRLTKIPTEIPINCIQIENDAIVYVTPSIIYLDSHDKQIMDARNKYELRAAGQIWRWCGLPESTLAGAAACGRIQQRSKGEGI